MHPKQLPRCRTDADAARLSLPAADKMGITLFILFIRKCENETPTDTGIRTARKTDMCVWLSGLVVSTLGIRARGPGFESRGVPLFHWVATLGKLFTHTASLVSQLQETGVQKGAFGA